MRYTTEIWSKTIRPSSVFSKQKFKMKRKITAFAIKIFKGIWLAARMTNAMWAGFICIALVSRRYPKESGFARIV